jgi:hypothetical protein
MYINYRRVDGGIFSYAKVFVADQPKIIITMEQTIASTGLRKLFCKFIYAE